MRQLALLIWCSSLLFLRATPASGQFTPITDPAKSDVLILRNGTELIGGFTGLERGIATLNTDAAGTVYVKWPRVVTATTRESFQIYLDDGRSYAGSLQSSDSPYQVVIQGVRDTLEVPTSRVVEMVRLGQTFWQRLDGSVDLGFNFTQQNSKIDLLFDFEVSYTVEKNRFALTFEGSFSRQEAVSDIERRDLGFLYGRELGTRWFLGFGAAVRRNTQLSLDRAIEIFGGPGRFIVATDRVTLGTFIAPGYRRELYEDEDPQTAVPLSVVTDFQWFTWSGRNSDLSSRLILSPVLNASGRWLIYFDASFKQELLADFNLRIGVNQAFDSKPPGDSNKNDISLLTSLGWEF